MSERPLAHLLFPNGASTAPFADETWCGDKVNDVTSAFWPDDDKRGYRVCAACKENYDDDR